MIQQKTDFLRIISEYFDNLKFDVRGKTICVGLSGGADSVALLRGLLLIKDKYGFSVTACHFNHMIRGEEADRDEMFCKTLCEALDVKLYRGRDDVPEYARVYKLSMEEAARKCRYAFFKRITNRHNIDYCATAHNMNDDAETLLLNLIRGSGSNGASAIATENNNVLRPLLKVGRNQIEDFLKLLQQQYINDSTNDSLEYTRNRVRKVIFPELCKINPSVIEAFSRFADSAREDRDYFENNVLENLDADLRTLHKAIRTRIIIKKYRDFSNTNPNSTIIKECENALFRDKRCLVHLSDKVEAIAENGKIEFFECTEAIDFSFDEEKLDFGNNTAFGERVLIDLSHKNFDKSENINKLSITAILSSDNIIGDMKVRNRRIGDKIKIHGMNKSLKKLFIEKRIPKEYRNIIPIILDEQGIIYVPFIGIADRVFSKNSENHVYINTKFNTINKERWINAYEK